MLYVSHGEQNLKSKKSSVVGFLTNVGIKFMEYYHLWVLCLLNGEKKEKTKEIL